MNWPTDGEITSSQTSVGVSWGLLKAQRLTDRLLNCMPDQLTHQIADVTVDIPRSVKEPGIDWQTDKLTDRLTNSPDHRRHCRHPEACRRARGWQTELRPCPSPVLRNAGDHCRSHPANTHATLMLRRRLMNRNPQHTPLSRDQDLNPSYQPHCTALQTTSPPTCSASATSEPQHPYKIREVNSKCKEITRLTLIHVVNDWQLLIFNTDPYIGLKQGWVSPSDP